MIDVEKILQLDYLNELLLQIEEHISSEKEKILKHYDLNMLESVSIEEVTNLFVKYDVKCDNLLHLFQDVYLDESFEYAQFYMDDIAYSSEQKQFLRENALEEIKILNSKIDLDNDQIFAHIMDVVKKTKLINLLVKVLKSEDLILGTEINELKELILTSSLLKDEDRVQASFSLVKYLIQSGRKILFNKENIDSSSFEHELDSVHKLNVSSNEQDNTNLSLPYYGVVLKYYDKYRKMFDDTGYMDIFDFIIDADSLIAGIDINFESVNRDNFCIHIASLLYQLNFISDENMEKEILDMLSKLDMLYENDIKLGDYKKERLLDIDKCFSELDSLDLNVKLACILDIVNKIKNRLNLIKMDLENNIIGDVKKENIDLEYQSIVSNIEAILSRINLINEIDNYNLKISNLFADFNNNNILNDEVSNLLAFIQDKLLDFQRDIRNNDLTADTLLEINGYFDKVDEIELTIKGQVELVSEEDKNIILNGFVLCDFNNDGKPYLLDDLDQKSKMIDRSIELNKLKKGFDSYSKLINELFLIGNTEKLDNNDSQGYNTDRLNVPVYYDPKNRTHENETGMYRLKYDRNGVERFIEQRIVLHHGSKMHQQVLEIIKDVLPDVSFDISRDFNLYINFASAMKLSETDMYSTAINRYKNRSPLYNLFIGNKNREEFSLQECKLIKEMINMSLNAFLELENINPYLHFEIIEQIGGVKTRG